MEPSYRNHTTFRKSPIHALCYAAPEDKNSAKFTQIFRTCVPEAHVEWYTLIEDLQDRMLCSFDRKTVALISITTEKDLIDLYFIQHLLRRVMVVLLLPDTECHTIAMGHRLHPCFMCTVNTDTSELMDALRSIVVHGIYPQPVEQFRNPFASLMPIRSVEFHGHMTEAA